MLIIIVPGLNCSAVILVIAIPTPSISASSTAPIAAADTAAEGPPRAANTAPVRAPLPIEFHGSSLRLTPIKQHSNVEKRPPHTPKLPKIKYMIFKSIKKEVHDLKESLCVCMH